MSSRVEQVAVLVDLLSSGKAVEHHSAAIPHALTLARELIACGEWGLCIELAGAARGRAESAAEQVECDLIRADALLGTGSYTAAAELLAPILESARSGKAGISQERTDWAALLMVRTLYRRHRLEEAWRSAASLRESTLARGESPALGWSALLLGNIAWVRGEASEAKRCYVEASVSASRLEDRRLEAMAASNIGRLNRHQCRWREAAEELEHARVLWTKLGNREATNECLRAQAIIEWKQGNLSAARQMPEGALLVSASGGNLHGAAYARQVRALIDLHDGNFSSADQLLSETLSFTGGGQSSRVLLLTSEFRGDVELEQGRAEPALEHYDEVLRAALAVVPKGDIVGELRRRRAECFYFLGRREEAYAEAQTGLVHCRELGDRYEEAATYRIAALSAAAVGRPDEAARLFDQGLALFEDIATPYEWGKLWLAYGDWLAGETSGPYRDARRALEAYQVARERFEAMGAKARQAQAEARIAGLAAEAPGTAVGASPGVGERLVTATPAGAATARRRGVREVERRSEWALEQFGVVTADAAMVELLEKVEKLAPSRAPVLILGESGTGKELIAQALHRLSGRRGELMAINCAALPREVIESELFGHMAGAFTGATRDKAGLLEVCAGGTALLDEVSEMSVELQARLLRFLETGEIRRVGATKATRVEVRVVAASNREAKELQGGESFRVDLYYRLAHAKVYLPPLRRRGVADIERLARHFLVQACEEERKRVTLSAHAMERLLGYGWPGNVRELKSMVGEAVVLARDGTEIGGDELHFESSGAPVTLGEELAQTEKRRIEEALRLSGQSQTEAAKRLGMPRTTLISRIKRHGIG